MITVDWPLADEEFATLLDHVELLIALMMSAILLMLWLAVRSPKIIVAILVTLFAGLAITTALGLAVIGTFNLLSVAFIPLFVGIGVDFGIQYSVRYRAERHALKDLEAALLSAGASMGPPLTVAAAATAACFFSLTPTDYAGLAQLGFIAGSGMIIAFLLSGTLLPALIKLLKPKAEEAEIGFARLAFLDRFLHRRQCEILASTSILVAIGLSLLPFLSFNADPLDLRSQRTESVASLLDLMKDPDTSPNTIDILVPSLASADEMSSGGGCAAFGRQVGAAGESGQCGGFLDGRRSCARSEHRAHATARGPRPAAGERRNLAGGFEARVGRAGRTSARASLHERRCQ